MNLHGCLVVRTCTRLNNMESLTPRALPWSREAIRRWTLCRPQGRNNGLLNGATSAPRTQQRAPATCYSSGLLPSEDLTTPGGRPPSFLPPVRGLETTHANTPVSFFLLLNWTFGPEWDTMWAVPQFCVPRVADSLILNNSFCLMIARCSF